MSKTAQEYTSSPRPTYEAPTLIRRLDVKRHIWGDRESGLVADWIYASTEKVHALVFGLAPGKWFRHSRAFRTVFGADEVFYVLQGQMLAMNPETGEVVPCKTGECLFLRKDTWHHVRAEGNEPLRVLEFFAPPPARGTSGAYAATRPYVETPRYTRDQLIGNHLGGPQESAFRRIEPQNRLMRVEAEIAIGLIVSTQHLTVAELSAPAGTCGNRMSHGGDAILFGLESEIMVRTFWGDRSDTFEISPQDAVFIPHRAAYELLSFAGPARAILGVAPSYLP